MQRVLLALAFLLFAGLKPIDSAPPLAIDVHVKPSVLDEYQLLTRQTPYTFTAQALVRPADQEGVAYTSVGLIVEPGKRETVTQKTDFFDVKFTVAVSEKRDRAATEVVVTRGDRIVHVQKSDIVMNPNAVQRYRYWRR